MVDMIASMRALEAGQKVIQTIDETLGKACHAGRSRLRRLARARKVSDPFLALKFAWREPSTPAACSKD
jgi:hypothetical protein